MENILESFTNCMAVENGLTEDAAKSLTTWLENEGVLDYNILRETYEEPTVKLHLVETANDA